MKWNTLVLCELIQRKNRLITGSLAIILGITVIVAINSIATYSQKAIAKELDALGANILILPPTATLVDYYSADLQSGELPEEYVTLLTTSNLEGLDNLSPKLSVPVNIKNKPIILTGILPKNEFENKASWQGAGVFSRPKSCGNVEDIFGLSKRTPKETLVRKRVIETLDANAVLVGSDISKKLHLTEGSKIEILNKTFNVSAILPQTGTIDDSRIFAHLHTVQGLTGKNGMINAIEVVGCCEQISKGLVSKINHLIPNAKVVTISQVVDTQIKTNRVMRNLSTLLVVIIIVIGGASIANDMYNNVYERRKEIGTLVALGANSSKVLKIFFLKAFMLGGIGGVGGYILGTFLAVILGPLVAGVPVLPVPHLILWSLLLSISIAVLASYFPARYAVRLDPCTVIQEI